MERQSEDKEIGAGNAPFSISIPNSNIYGVYTSMNLIMLDRQNKVIVAHFLKREMTLRATLRDIFFINLFLSHTKPR